MVTLRQARLDSHFRTAFILEKLGIKNGFIHAYETGKRKVPEHLKDGFRKLYKRDDILF
jgi:hypothetical protein